MNKIFIKNLKTSLYLPYKNNEILYNALKDMIFSVENYQKALPTVIKTVLVTNWKLNNNQDINICGSLSAFLLNSVLNLIKRLKLESEFNEVVQNTKIDNDSLKELVLELLALKNPQKLESLYDFIMFLDNFEMEQSTNNSDILSKVLGRKIDIDYIHSMNNDIMKRRKK